MNCQYDITANLSTIIFEINLIKHSSIFIINIIILKINLVEENLVSKDIAWRLDYSQNSISQSETPRKSKNPDILKLKKKNELLKIEIKILKKDTSFFMKENH
jgi:hypothetical protein